MRLTLLRALAVGGRTLTPLLRTPNFKCAKCWGRGFAEIIALMDFHHRCSLKRSYYNSYSLPTMVYLAVWVKCPRPPVVLSCVTYSATPAFRTLN